MCASRPWPTCPIRCRWNPTWWWNSTRADQPFGWTERKYKGRPFGRPFCLPRCPGLYCRGGIHARMDEFGIARDVAFEGPEAPLDRDQLDDRCPGACEELEGPRHLAEGGEDLLEQA